MGAQAVRLTNVDIDNALKNNHFDVIFQPIFAMADGSLLRMESFVRWTHPGLGVLPPGAFISFFETQGRMGELTRHVIETAIEHYIGWRGTNGPGLSVNLSLSDLTDESFPAWLKKYLKAKKFPAKLLTLECPLPPTPTTIPDANKSFAALTKTGCPLAIEIRGRANEALRDLSPFPFAEVKTGGSAILRFARTVRGGPGLTAISELLEMAKSNNARIVAVGVEDQPSLTALSSLGFTAAQGNFMAGVSDLQGFAMNTVNTVRSALGLDPLEQEQLRAQYAADKQDQPDMVTTEKGGKPQKSDQIAEAQSDDKTLSEDEIRAKKIEAAKKAIREKKLKAREVAKIRAAKKARDAREATAKAEIELADQRKEIEEAKAAAAVAANARKLQNRLSRVFDENEPEPPLELNTPDTTPEPELSDEKASIDEVAKLEDGEIH
ncbi:MAG: EAL domain-containing protein, partial [Parvularculaceae bacterium]